MLFVYKVGRDAIERQFGVVPLSVHVRSGQELYSDNGRLAAIAGYGIGRIRFYVGHDYTIQFSMMTPENFGCHDLDLVKAPELPRRWIEANKDKRWMGFNEMCAYIHSTIEITAGVGIAILLNYDKHYCRYFSDHTSRWTLELSDRIREKLGEYVSIMINGKSEKIKLKRMQTIEIPAGVKFHRVVISGK